MKRAVLLTLLIMFGLTSLAYACKIKYGQEYEYEWTIVNAATGEVISQGSGTIIPTAQTAKGHRNMETFVRANTVDGWNVKSWSRTVDGVRQRLKVKIDGHEH